MKRASSRTSEWTADYADVDLRDLLSAPSASSAVKQSVLAVLLVTSSFLHAQQPPAPPDRGQAVREAFGGDVALPAYHALIIGINDYQHWPKLLWARDQATTLGEVLRQNYGFADVRLLLDGQATRRASR